MKLETLVGIFFLLCTFMVPTALASGGDAIGSLPAATAEQSETVKPGESHENEDGVNVENSMKSGGDAKVNPKKGNKNSATTVTTKSRFDGTISGLDSNDTVNMGSSNTGEVKGDGGRVNLSGGCRVTVTNTSTALNPKIMTVSLPSGATATVAPGSSTTFNT